MNSGGAYWKGISIQAKSSLSGFGPLWPWRPGRRPAACGMTCKPWLVPAAWKEWSFTLPESDSPSQISQVP